MGLVSLIYAGFRAALIAPAMTIFLVALTDYDMLREYLLHANSNDVQGVLKLLIFVGFLSGALWNAYFHIWRSPTGHGSTATIAGGGGIAPWYWSLTHDGRDLALREATLSRCIPNADVRWAIDDLIKELSKLGNANGSDLLDRKVAKTLGLNGTVLRPTQNIDDSIKLLSLRYHGHSTKYLWDAKTEKTESGYRAYLAVRENERDNWRRCLIAEGPSAMTAITIAALTRETWSFTT